MPHLLAAAASAEVPERASPTRRALLRAMSIKTIRESGEMITLKRTGWTEAEIDGLPPKEHDYFERKAGKLYSQPHFDTSLAKALSAFANSGGGHLILGVDDKTGLPDGLPRQVGGADMRDWIEQKVPSLLDHELQDFRVHEVQPALLSRIPSGLGVFVIDIGDSALAPHMSRRDHVHYHRQGGRSVPASAFYLELLRQRLTAPRLVFELTAVQPARGGRRPPGPVVALNAGFIIRNEGRVAAYKWRMRLTTADLPSERMGDLVPESHNFPPEVSLGSITIGDTAILPGDRINFEKPIAFQMRPNPASGRGLFDECDLLLGAKLGFRIATEVSPGEDKEVRLGDKLRSDELRAYIINNKLVD